MANALQEANDLLTLIGDDAVWSKLRAVGVDPEAREQLKLALGAARTAQSQWVVVRDAPVAGRRTTSPSPCR